MSSSVVKILGKMYIRMGMPGAKTRQASKCKCESIQEQLTGITSDKEDNRRHQQLTSLDNDRERNGNDRDTAEDQQAKEQENLDQREVVHSLGLHVLREGFLGVLFSLHEEHEEALEELVGSQTGQTHEQEHAVQNGHRNELQHIQRKECHQDQEMDTQVGQSGLLDTDNLAVNALLGQGIQVVQTAHSGSDQPRKTQQGVDGNHQGNENGIPVVRLAVRQLVAGMVDQMPGNTCWVSTTRGEKQCA